jgi:hypothetical protein
LQLHKVATKVLYHLDPHPDSESMKVRQRMRALEHANEERNMPNRKRFGVTAPNDVTNRAVLIYFVAFFALSCIVMIINRRFLYPGMDGLFWEVLQSYRPRYGSWFSVQQSDPLQGMFDIFPQAYRGTLLLDAISALPLDVRVNGAIIHGAYAAWAAVSTYAMARSAGIMRGTALIAAILTPVLTLAGLLGSIGVVSHAFSISPNYSFIISSTILVIALFWMIDGQLNARFFLGGLLAFLVTAEACNAFALHMTLLLPTAIVFGVGGLIASESRRELTAKLGWATAIVAGLIILGMPAYLYALGSNTAHRFFFDELNDFTLRAIPANVNLKDDVLYVLQWWEGKTAVIVSTISIAAAAYLAPLGVTRKLRVFACCFLVIVFGTGLIAFISHFWFYFSGYDYRGPNPFHMVYIVWPFHLIFLALVIQAALVWLVRLAPFAWRAHWDNRNLAVHAVVAAAMALPAYGVIVLKDARYIDLTTKPNAITNYLGVHNPVASGAPYRGIVASFLGTHGRDPVGLADLYVYVWLELQAFNNNDFTSYGLWPLGIPTLNQFNTMMTPQFYLMLTELLARPSDRQARSFAVITVPNQRILKLWGVRFVIADYTLPFGTERINMPVQVMTDWFPKEHPELYRGISFDSPVRLFELAGVNLGNYSPTSVIEAATAKAVVDHMREPGFDGARTVIVTEGLRGSFVPATQASMTVERGGLSLRASSTGESLLVLPVQYSHCWQLRDAPNATLFRANLMQLGIRFSNELKAQLRQVFGPLWNSHCRVLDANDMERVEISKARSE